MEAVHTSLSFSKLSTVLPILPQNKSEGPNRAYKALLGPASHLPDSPPVLTLPSLPSSSLALLPQRLAQPVISLTHLPSSLSLPSPAAPWPSCLSAFALRLEPHYPTQLRPDKAPLLSFRCVCSHSTFPVNPLLIFLFKSTLLTPA